MINLFYKKGIILKIKLVTDMCKELKIILGKIPNKTVGKSNIINKYNSLLDISFTGFKFGELTP